MSLINDVLRDLERRQAPTGQGPTSRSTSRKSRTAARKRHRWPLWLLAALVLGAVLHLTLDGGQALDRPEPVASLKAQIPRESTQATPSRPELPSGRPSSGTELPPDRPASPPDTASASTRARSGHLTEPEAATTTSAAPPDAEAPALADVQSPSASLQSGESSSREKKAGNSASGGEETSGSPAATISIERSGENADGDDPLAAAKRLLARGQFERAESRLRRLVEAQPRLTEAHELLAGTLIRRRQPLAARRVLEAGLEHAEQPAVLAALLGRMLLEAGEAPRARAVLTAHAPPLAEAPDYHLLLAAVHRQTGDHETAMSHYRQLSESLPGRGQVWVGLGASLESLDEPAQAAEAYQRALDGDDPRAAAFARRRLAALEPLIGEPQ